MSGISAPQLSAFQALDCRPATVALPAKPAVSVKACTVTSPPAELPQLPIGMRSVGAAIALRKPAGKGASVSIRGGGTERRAVGPDERRGGDRRVEGDRRGAAPATSADAAAPADGAVPVVIAGEIDHAKGINAMVAAAATDRAARLLAADGVGTLTVPNNNDALTVVAKWIQDTRLTQPDAARALALINEGRTRRDPNAQPVSMEQVAEALAAAALSMNAGEVSGPERTITIPNEATFNALVQDALEKAAREGTLGMPMEDALDIIATMNVSAQEANGIVSTAALEAAEEAAVRKLEQEGYRDSADIVVTAKAHKKKNKNKGSMARRGRAILDASPDYERRAQASSWFGELGDFATGAAHGDRATAIASQRRAESLARENRVALRRNLQRTDTAAANHEQVTARTEQRIVEARREMSDAIADDDGSVESRNRIARIV